MSDVRRAGADLRNVIYAQPCKTARDVRRADSLGVPLTVVDSPEEVEKLRGWRGGVLIRLAVPDAGSAQPFSRKFGAPAAWVPDILHALQSAGQRHVGWSFHVGSVCGDASQYTRAIEMCAEVATYRGANTGVVDIGGGFVPAVEEFRAAAAAIRGAQCLFPSTTRWIGEPGRFLSGPVARAEIRVIGKKRALSGDGWRYTVDESVYGLFSNIPFDGFRPRFELMSPWSHFRPMARATVFGRTCDSADCLAENVELPELFVGDTLSVENMGAYTVVSASEFNGFPKPRLVYQ